MVLLHCCDKYIWSFNQEKINLWQWKYTQNFFKKVDSHTRWHLVTLPYFVFWTYMPQNARYDSKNYYILKRKVRRICWWVCHLSWTNISESFLVWWSKCHVSVLHLKTFCSLMQWSLFFASFLRFPLIISPDRFKTTDYYVFSESSSHAWS